MPGLLEPFRIDVPDTELEDLRDRLRRTRWAPQVDTGQERGIPEATLRDLAGYWADGFDWRAQEARLNAHDQFRTVIDGQPVHFLHVRSTDPDATPLLMTHGWPGSVAEFLDVLGPLTDPGPGACHLVVPHLPGYGFSSPIAGTGWTFTRIAAAWIELVNRLGYDRFAVQGGDWGSIVSREVAAQAPDRVVGMHLNLLLHDVPRSFEPVDDVETAAVARHRHYHREGAGYFTQQSTRPNTLGYGLADSPVGQLAWIAEKVQEWTDPAEPFGGISRDDLLTNVSIYWFTRTAASAATSYWERYHERTPLAVCRVPTAVAAFAHEILPPIRRLCEAEGHNIVRWTDLPHGGHFAAAEQPEVFARDVRDFVSTLRT